MAPFCSWIPEDSWSKLSVFLVRFLNFEFITSVRACACVTCMRVCVCTCHGTGVEVTPMPVSQTRATEDLPG